MCAWKWSACKIHQFSPFKYLLEHSFSLQNNQIYRSIWSCTLEFDRYGQRSVYHKITAETTKTSNTTNITAMLTVEIEVVAGTHRSPAYPQCGRSGGAWPPLHWCAKDETGMSCAFVESYIQALCTTNCQLPFILEGIHYFYTVKIKSRNKISDM